MKILFYRYNSICEPNIISCFQKFGLEVCELHFPSGNTSYSETLETLSAELKRNTFLFVFSINFFPFVSEICEIYKIPYVCWTVDSPVMELFSSSVRNRCNRIFLFDKAQYDYFSPRNPQNMFHLPLATDVNTWTHAISGCTPALQKKFSADVSFVGSLYKEKNPYAAIKNLPDRMRGYLDGILEAQLKIYGCFLLENLLTDDITKELSKQIPDLYLPFCQDNLSERYVIANQILGMQLAVTERERLLNALAKNHNVHVYTLSDTSSLQGVIPCGGVKTLTEMPLVFAYSKINLNFTIRPIQTGLSQRVFDVLGCGGFLLTNYQTEIPDLYTPGEDLEIFSSTEELLDKTNYYLTHEEARKKIAQNGYRKTLAHHTYEARIGEMIRILNETL